MRFPIVPSLILLVMSLCGCQSTAPGRNDGSQFFQSSEAQVSRAAEIDFDGVVVSQNEDPPFVVMEFGSSELPSKDRFVSLFRLGQRVGLVRVTGPIEAPHVIGNLIEGSAQVGDGAKVVEEVQSRFLNFGKVVMLNEGSNFVVVEFVSGRFPPAGSDASVFRDGNKVGEVRISRQSTDFLITADIREGPVRVGDEVRPD